MSKHKLKRRDFIWKTSQLVLGLSIISRELNLLSSFASERIDKSLAATTTISNLTPEQIYIIRSITNIIIPTDENPGAKEAGIAEYIAQVLKLQGKEKIQQTQQVLGLIDMQAMNLFSKPYNQLSETNKEKIVDWLATDSQLADFWTKLRTLTVLKFYSLPMGYKPVGLPGPTIDQGGIPNPNCF